MKEEILPLAMVGCNKEVKLVSILGGRGLRARLADMGLIEGARFKVLHAHPSGPCIILIGNTRLVLGYGMAQKILVESINNQ